MTADSTQVKGGWGGNKINTMTGRQIYPIYIPKEIKFQEEKMNVEWGNETETWVRYRIQFIDKQKTQNKEVWLMD